MIDFFVDTPNWLKPLPGLAVLGASYGVYLAGFFWPWGWAVGGVLLLAGICLMEKPGGYNF